MKMTLLEITQNILSAMDAEEVSSIHDTVESLQVAEEVRTAYRENFTNFEVHGFLKTITLEALQSPTQYPNVLRVPENVDKFEWIKYNIGTLTSPVYKDICFVTPTEFLERALQRKEGFLAKDLNSGVPYFIDNLKDPDYWTMFDDKHIVFDSFNSTLDSTLQNSKSLVYAQVFPDFLMQDNFVPELPAKFFPMLLAEAKAASFINYKGVSNGREEMRARRQRVQHQNNRSRYENNVHRKQGNPTTTRTYGRR